jgi:hypothetical protein
MSTRELDLSGAARRHRNEAWRALFAEMKRRDFPLWRQGETARYMVAEMLADDSRSVAELVQAALPPDTQA